MPKDRPGKGGPRRPSNPAPVSGPGALSQRTDGRAAAGKLIEETPSTGYGDKVALQAAQSSMPDGRSAPGGPPPVDVFGPTGRPEEPITAGAEGGAGPGPESLLAEDPQAVLRAMLSVYPHPDIYRLANFYGIA